MLDLLNCLLLIILCLLFVITFVFIFIGTLKENDRYLKYGGISFGIATIIDLIAVVSNIVINITIEVIKLF